MSEFKDETIVAPIGQLEGLSIREPAVDVLGGPSMGQQFILEEGEVIVGRSKDADIIINDESISRHHFKLKIKDKIVTIEDLKSTNGTFVNGHRVKLQTLGNNDKIQISSATVLRFSYIDLVDKNTHERFYEMALYDPVTMAHTKRYFFDRLNHEFAHSGRRHLPLSLVFFDLDYFKKVNDSFGHPAGDFILQRVADSTRQIIRSEDIFARYGGEEFAILMRDSEEIDAIRLAERLRKNIEQSDYVFEGKKIPVTISVGISCYWKSNFKTSDELLKAADEYLYFSKANGRNRVSAESLLTSQYSS